MLPYFPTSANVAELLQAIEKEDASCLKGWLGQNNPNAAVLGDWTAIHLAVACGNETACRTLLDGGASPSPQCASPRTPLMLAAELGFAPITRLLLEAGAAVDEVSFDGFTALSLACGSAMGSVEDLIAAGANLNWVDGSGGSPLLRSALWCPNLVAELLAAGADPDYPLPNGSVMSQVAEVGSANTIKQLLLAGANFEARAQTGESLMYILAKSGRIDLCKLLIDKGVDPSSELLRHEGKLPHQVAVGDTAAYLAKVVQAKQYRDRLTVVARRGRDEEQLDDEEEKTVFM